MSEVAQRQKKLTRDRLAEAIGRRLSAYLEENGLSHEQCAQRLNIPRQHIWKLKEGRGLPSVETLWRMRRALGLDINDLFDGVEP